MHSKPKTLDDIRKLHRDFCAISSARPPAPRRWWSRLFRLSRTDVTEPQRTVESQAIGSRSSPR